MSKIDVLMVVMAFADMFWGLYIMQRPQHIGRAITWFCLAIFTLLLVLIVMVGRLG